MSWDVVGCCGQGRAGWGGVEWGVRLCSSTDKCESVRGGRGMERCDAMRRGWKRRMEGEVSCIVLLVGSSSRGVDAWLVIGFVLLMLLAVGRSLSCLDSTPPSLSSASGCRKSANAVEVATHPSAESANWVSSIY
jgi:hypothetical protein